MIAALKKKGIRVNHNQPREEIVALYSQHFPQPSNGAEDPRKVFSEIRAKIMDTAASIRDLKVRSNRVRAIVRKLENIARLAR